MKVMVDYNGWQKVLDIPSDIEIRGVFEFQIMPPLDLTCDPHKPLRNSATYTLVVYATGRYRGGLPLFSNNYED